VGAERKNIREGKKEKKMEIEKEIKKQGPPGTLMREKRVLRNSSH